ncbi:MAG: autotransporter domain-containing protein [Herminiimonas sp.]|uniref:autotransporter outer membrane beta-barrel domain-containing protein n=1 Tax=Herminiimonas sp. TaxID=1926289 RepID=UPI002724DC25|nr:autotransporter outer membrane beta-barrel domain-containing protein [Herminiimonas sp.]MDO9422502.1 autotransporter domain-containing protein [Herminiimonas sp.]
MRFSHPQLRPLPLVLALQAIFALPSYAVALPDVTIAAGAPTTTAQSLTANNAVVQQGGSLIVSSPTTTAAITVNAGTSTITNSGTISQTTGGRAIDANAASTILRIDNNVGGVINAVGDVTIRVGKATDKFVINNQGTISQTGISAGGKRAIKVDVDFTTTGNQIINGSTTNTRATISSTGDDAMRLGSNTTLTNYGQIFSTGVVNTKCADYLGTTNCPSSALSAADGVAIENGMKNVAILNYGSITGPRHGIDGGDPVAASADSDLIGVERLIVTAANGDGVLFDKVVNGVTTSVTIINPVVINYAGGTITGNNGSGVGFDGHGVVINYGTITGQYAGAGKVYDHGGLGLTTSNGDGDGVDIDGVAYIENYGRIQGLGAGGFDSGGSPNGADGIAAGGGTIINHAGATIYGASKGILIDDGSDGTSVASGRGTATATGAAAIIVNEGTITGEKKVAVGLVGNFNDTLTNAATGIITGGADAMRLGENNSTVAGAAIQMGAGDDTLTNYGRIEGKNGLAIDMGTGNDTLRLFGGTVIGTIDGGIGTNLLETNGTQLFNAGQVSNFQNITVKGGSTTFNYALGTVGNVQVDTNGNLRVNGAFATTDLAVNGTLQAPSSGAFRTVSVAGNYVQGTSGVLETRIGASNASDQIAVTGTATLTNGATIRPLIAGAVADGSTYTLISAATLSASSANLNVDSGSGAFYSYSLQGSGNNLQLVAHQKNGIAAAAPQRFESLANALNSAASNGLTTSQQGLTLLNALQALPTTQALSNATSQLAPETNAAAQSASNAAQGSVFSAFDNRIDSARSGGPLAMGKTGLAGGDSVGNRFWLQGLAAIAKQDARKGANGYDLDAQGIAAGYEMDLNTRDMVGFSGGYTQAGSDGKDSGAGDDTDVKSLHVGAYFSRTDNSYTLDAGVAVSANRYSSQRTVTIPGFTETLSGKYSGYQVGARVEYGIPFALDEKWSGRWLMGARVGYLDNGAYSESGGASAQNVASASANSVQSVFGVEFVNKLSAASSATLRARYLHEFADTPAINASFASGGPSFRLDGVQPGRDALQLGLGYRNVTNQGTTIAIGYDMEIKDKYLGHQLTAKAIWNF